MTNSWDDDEKIKGVVAAAIKGRTLSEKEMEEVVGYAKEGRAVARLLDYEEDCGFELTLIGLDNTVEKLMQVENLQGRALIEAFKVPVITPENARVK